MIGGISLEHIRINSYWKLVKAYDLHPVDQNITRLMSYRVSMQAGI